VAWGTAFYLGEGVGDHEKGGCISGLVSNIFYKGMNALYDISSSELLADMAVQNYLQI